MLVPVHASPARAARSNDVWDDHAATSSFRSDLCSLFRGRILRGRIICSLLRRRLDGPSLPRVHRRLRLPRLRRVLLGPNILSRLCLVVYSII